MGILGHGPSQTLPSYLISVVIGKFAQHQQYTREYKHNGNKQKQEQWRSLIILLAIRNTQKRCYVDRYKHPKNNEIL